MQNSLVRMIIFLLIITVVSGHSAITDLFSLAVVPSLVSRSVD